MEKVYLGNWNLCALQVVVQNSDPLTYHSDDISIITLHIYNYSYLIDHSDTRAYVRRYNISSLNIRYTNNLYLGLP